MYQNDWNIMDRVQPMLVGSELKEKLNVFTTYDESIQNQNQAVRLMELNNLHSFYLASDMSVEIYTKLYLAMVRSLQKKESKLAVCQRNSNGRNLRAALNGLEPSFGGIIGGSDSFSIIGCSGIGKTTAIAKAVQLFGGENVIEMENPYCKIIPVITVQCPFDCSVKSMLLAILQKVDNALGTAYYDNTVRAKSNINTMLISTAQILLNHVAVVCIDEIQNLIKHRAGIQLVSMLTELLNESGISIVFVGTPEIQPFFESVDYLARRTLGLVYGKCAYNGYFREFCTKLWEFQYVKNRSGISDAIINWLYQHCAGILAHVIVLFYTAQEISILDERERVDIETLESAYQRMETVHMHIQPDVSMKKVTVKRKETIPNADGFVGEHSAHKGTDEKWSFSGLAKEAKQYKADMLQLLQGKVSITEIIV